MMMEHAVDPRDELRAKVGMSLDDVAISANNVLVAVYKRPEKTAGGIILTDQNRDEDNYQSKIGLVLKVGPTAFDYDPTDDQWGFQFLDVREGDWIIFRPSEGWALDLKGNETVRCRMLADTAIKGKVLNPDRVW
jgi:co-chaperonin GroES (HSP10)